MLVAFSVCSMSSEIQLLNRFGNVLLLTEKFSKQNPPPPQFQHEAAAVLCWSLLFSKDTF